MHPKALLTTLLAGQVALAAVIPIEHDAREINPINGLPAPGSNLNPISGLPTPHGRKHKHQHKKLGHNGKNPLSGLPVHARDANNGVNPINGLPAPGSNLNPISGLPTPHGRKYKHKHKHSHIRLGHNGKNPLSGLPVHEREAEAEPVRIVTHMHTSTSVVWIHATPKPGVAEKGEPDHPKQNGGNKHPQQYGPNDGGNQARPSHRPRPGSDGNNPINGLPAPGSPVYDRPHKGDGQGDNHPKNGQGNHPKNGQGAHPKNGQGAHPQNGQGQGNNNAHPKQNGQGNQDKPHTHKPHTLKPGGITIRPLTSATFHGVPTMVPIPKDKDPLHKDTPAATHTTHAPLINQTPQPTHVPHLQPDPKHKHQGDGKGKGKGEGVIGKKPSRRDVAGEADEISAMSEVSELSELSEMPEAYGEFAEKAEQLSAFDEGITGTDAEGENDYYTGYSPYDAAGEAADAVYERALEASEAGDEENKDFLVTYWADKAWWEEYGRSLGAQEDLE